MTTGIVKYLSTGTASLTALQVFMPTVEDIVDLNPTLGLSAGISVYIYLLGWWMKGRVIDIDIDDSNGKVNNWGLWEQQSKYVVKRSA